MIWWKWRTTRANNQTKVSLIRALWIIYRQTKQSSYSRSSKSLTNQEEIKTFRYYAPPFRLLRSWRTLFMLAATISRTGSLSSRVGLARRSWCSGEYPVYDDAISGLFLSCNSFTTKFLTWLAVTTTGSGFGLDFRPRDAVLFPVFFVVIFSYRWHDLRFYFFCCFVK